MGTFTQQQVNKKYKNKYVDFYKTYDYTKKQYIYEIRKVYSEIHENTTLGQDVGTAWEYTR